jgi:hypothetical protein
MDVTNHPRPLFAVLAVALFALALGVPARASADDVDQRFLSAIHSAGITQLPDDRAIEAGHDACTPSAQFGGTGLGLMAQGLSYDQANNFLNFGARAYCPEKLAGLGVPPL